MVLLGCGLGATDRLNRSIWIELNALGRLLSISSASLAVEGKTAAMNVRAAAFPPSPC